MEFKVLLIFFFTFQINEQFQETLTLAKSLETENETLKAAIAKQEKLSKDLERNFSSLLLTARGEINRKQREIVQLRY